MRRKLLILLFKQKYPDSVAFGDQAIEEDVDRKIGQLKQRNRHGFASLPDEIFIECLIRAKYDEDAAFQMLTHNRPNLVGDRTFANVIFPHWRSSRSPILLASFFILFKNNFIVLQKPPPEAVHPRGPTTTTMENGIRPLHEQWRALNQEADENEAAVVLVKGDVSVISCWKRVSIKKDIVVLKQHLIRLNIDCFIVIQEWKNAMHIIPAIIELRGQYNNQNVDELVLSVCNKMNMLTLLIND
jgi:hypothetical protein